ncbi:MAG: Ig-like domain-containing protein, partial [Clostridiales Family XIII bacterium]|nr:Ig-like domain-containing protein [Clostridiales Family XIII bacterium]
MKHRHPNQTKFLLKRFFVMLLAFTMLPASFAFAMQDGDEQEGESFYVNVYLDKEGEPPSDSWQSEGYSAGDDVSIPVPSAGAGWNFTYWEIDPQDGKTIIPEYGNPIQFIMPSHVVNVHVHYTPDEEEAAVTAVTVSPDAVSIEKGKTQQFVAQVHGTGEYDESVTWSLQGASGSEISQGGLLAVGAGETSGNLTVTATSNQTSSVSGAAAVTVVTDPPDPPAVTAVTVSPDTVSIEKGKTQQFVAQVSGTGDYDESVTWSLQGASGSEISQGGLLTVGAGETSGNLTVTAASNQTSSVSGAAAVTIVTDPPPPAVTAVTVSPDAVSIERGKTQQFTAQVYGTGDYSHSVRWGLSGVHEPKTSIDPYTGILAVSADETNESFSVFAESTADQTIRGTATVNVVIPATVTGVKVTPNPASVERGKTQQFTATVSGTGDYDRGVIWSLSDAFSSTIDQNGLLTVAADYPASGNLLVVAESTKNHSAQGSAAVTVTSSVTGVTVSPNTASVENGKTQQFTATVSGTGNDDSGVTWSLQGASSVSTAVSQNGLLTVAAGETSGKITVTATSKKDLTVKGAATVTVVTPVSVTGVKIDPNAANVAKGAQKQFAAQVSGTGNYDSGVTWSLEDASSAGTAVSQNGLLTVAADETSETFTVTAVSKVNPSAKGTALVRVTSSFPGTVTGITVSPGPAQVNHSSQLLFTAAVSGTGEYDRDVTWSAYNNAPVTFSSVIRQDGLLIVNATELNETFYVEATSKQNPNISGRVLVTITDTGEPTQIQRVELSDSGTTLNRGASRFLYVDVYGTNGYHRQNSFGIVSWRIEPESSTSAVSLWGELKIAQDEPNQQLTVYATSTLDPSVSGSAVINVGSEPGEASTVTGVRITKPQFTNVIYVERGKIYPFEALVEGSGSPDQSVSWELSSTAFSAFSGNSLYVHRVEIAGELTVIARSVQDPAKYHSARLIVGTPPPVTIDGISVTSVPDAGGNTWIRPGDTRRYTATVKGSYGLEPVPQDVTWSVLGGTDSNTAIDGTGLLRVGSNESAATLTVMARSPHGSATGSTPAYPRKPVNAASGIGITPAAANALPGAQLRLNVTVNSETADPAWFSWSVTPGASAAVDTFGMLKIGAGQSAGQVLTVRATSQDYPQKSAEATISVSASASQAAAGGGGGGGGSPAAQAVPAAAVPEPAAVLPDKAVPLASGAPAPAAGSVSEVFADVPASAWFRDSVQYVYDRGYFLGVGDGSFAPGAAMTRGMFVTALGRLAGINAAAYTKASLAVVNPGDWFAPYTE